MPAGEVVNTNGVKAFIARMRRAGHSFGYSVTNGKAKSPYVIIVSDLDRIGNIDRHRIKKNFRAIVLELMAENYTKTGLRGREARRTAKQQDVLTRMGFTIDELHAFKFKGGRVEIVPKAAIRGKKP